AGFLVETEIVVYASGVVVEAERVPHVSRALVQLRQRLEVARLVLTQPLRAGGGERTVQRRQREARLAQGVVGGPQLTQRVLLARGVADGVIPLPCRVEHSNRGEWVAQPNVEHPEVAQRV